MHMRRIVLTIPILLVTISILFGQTSRGYTSRARRARDAEARREVLATDARRREALLRGDPAPLRQIYADDYTLVTRAGVIHTKSDQINDVTSGKLRYVKIEVSEQTVRVYGDGVVILCREKSEIVRGDQQAGGDSRLTRVYKRFGRNWRVIATHASPVGQ